MKIKVLLYKKKKGGEFYYFTKSKLGELKWVPKYCIIDRTKSVNTFCLLVCIAHIAEVALCKRYLLVIGSVCCWLLFKVVGNILCDIIWYDQFTTNTVIKMWFSMEFNQLYLRTKRCGQFQLSWTTTEIQYKYAVVKLIYNRVRLTGANIWK
jgi:hypothetical protein